MNIVRRQSLCDAIILHCGSPATWIRWHSAKRRSSDQIKAADQTTTDRPATGKLLGRLFQPANHPDRYHKALFAHRLTNINPPSPAQATSW